MHRKSFLCYCCFFFFDEASPCCYFFFLLIKSFCSGLPMLLCFFFFFSFVFVFLFISFSEFLGTREVTRNHLCFGLAIFVFTCMMVSHHRKNLLWVLNILTLSSERPVSISFITYNRIILIFRKPKVGWWLLKNLFTSFRFFLFTFIFLRFAFFFSREWIPGYSYSDTS